MGDFFKRLLARIEKVQMERARQRMELYKNSWD